MKLTKKQKEIVKLMQEGYILLVGRSEFTGSVYQYISKGFHNVYFRSNTFSQLIQKGLVYQDNGSSDWYLTTYAENLDL